MNNSWFFPDELSGVSRVCQSETASPPKIATLQIFVHRELKEENYNDKSNLFNHLNSFNNNKLNNNNRPI